MNRLFAMLGLLALAPLAPARAELPQYMIRDLGTFGGLEAYGRDVNEAGHVVGYIYHGDGSTEAFLWDGDFHSLGSGTAFAINDMGQVVGSGGGSAFLWDGQRHTLPFAQARDINNAGDVVGASATFRPVLMRNGQLVQITATAGVAMAINDSGVVVGGYDSQSGLRSDHAFVWNSGVFRDLGTYSGPESYADDINNTGVVIGWTNVAPVDPSPNFGRLSFVWDGQMHILEGGQNVQGINDLGWLVGSADGATKAIVMSGSEMLFLPGLGGRTSAASAISNNGLIAGRAMAPDGTVHAVLWEPVPEPATATGLLTCLALMRLCTKLRRSQS